jgi:predicted transposase/invertase (TIGR01784 family)
MFQDVYGVEVPMLHRRFPSLLQNDVFIDVFANPRRTGILKNFLNAVFASEGVSLISNLSLSPRESNRLDLTGKLTIVDVKAVTDAGETIQVEVQVQLHEGLAKRILYTWSQLYGRAISAGEDYRELLPVRSIWILARNLFGDDQKFHSFTTLDAANGTILCPDLHIVTMELRKWGDATMLDTDLDRWAYLLGNAERIDPDNPPEFLRRSSLEEAMSAMKVWTKEQLDGYQADKEFREKILYNTIRNVATEQGMEQGMAKGIEQGKKQAAISIARGMLATGIPVPEIARITGLAPEEIA